MSQSNDSHKCSQTGCKCPSTGCKSSSVGRISPPMERISPLMRCKSSLICRRGKFIHRPRLEVNNCICLKGRMGAIDGIIKCFCEGDIKCEYCNENENKKCYCETATSQCICEDYCTLQCSCCCHGDLKISVKESESIESIKTILLDIEDINSFLPDYFEKTITCSCNSLCDGCECVCHNEEKKDKKDEKKDEKEQVSCACNPMICSTDCSCVCHPEVPSCTCNKECPIGCKCSINCKGGIYCFNSCLSSCSCKCHKQEKPMCACSPLLCDDKCECGCHKSSSSSYSYECKKGCFCGCHLQCVNEI